MQTGISLPILQISNMLSQHYKYLQERQYLSCLSENSKNEKNSFKNINYTITLYSCPTFTIQVDHLFWKSA
jgi:hypothetical protein